MNFLRAMLFSACILTLTFALCQQEPMPAKVDPATVKMLQEQEKQMNDSVAESNKHPGPKFGALQCRADAQKWTTDPFDNKDARNLSVNTSIMVNGQFRSISPLTPHVAMTKLMQRVYEMAVCRDEDANFEKQYSTYSSIYRSYKDEITFRYDYFLTKHNLREQFFKEDAEMNK